MPNASRWKPLPKPVCRQSEAIRVGHQDNSLRG
jgi:hypothetical protein